MYIKNFWMFEIKKICLFNLEKKCIIIKKCKSTNYKKITWNGKKSYFFILKNRFYITFYYICISINFIKNIFQNSVKKDILKFYLKNIFCKFYVKTIFWLFYTKKKIENIY